MLRVPRGYEDNLQERERLSPAKLSISLEQLTFELTVLGPSLKHIRAFYSIHMLAFFFILSHGIGDLFIWLLDIWSRVDKGRIDLKQRSTIRLYTWLSEQIFIHACLRK